MNRSGCSAGTSSAIRFSSGGSYSTARGSGIRRLDHDRPRGEILFGEAGVADFPDRRRALREAKRLLEPDGELLVLEFFRPGNVLLGRVTSAWLRLMAALFARRNTSAYRYLRESMDGMVSADDFVRLAAEEGFALEGRRFFFPCCTCLRLRKEVKHDPPARS